MNTSARESRNSVSVAKRGRWPQSAKLSDELPPKCKICTLEEVAVLRIMHVNPTNVQEI